MMSDQKKDFRSCPFCGSAERGDEGVQLRLASTADGYFAVTCFCGASGPIRNSEEKATEAWNTRDYSNGHSARHSLSVVSASGLANLKGSLKSFEFIILLQFMSSANKTGVLFLRQGQEARALYFRDGRIIAANGNEGLRLGQIGFIKGLISQIQLQEALVNVKKTGRRMGEVLLKLNYVTEDSLKEIILHQIREIVLELSLWESGDFEYRDYPVKFYEAGTEHFDTLGLILDAVVRKDERCAASKGSLIDSSLSYELLGNE
jgi:Lar family restriction alleviation protein